MTDLHLDGGDGGNRKRRRKPSTTFALINSHVKREYRMIDKTKLVVPVNEYQRDESEGRISSEIAQNFDVVAFGAITVIQSESGELRVLDGGTRLSAAMKRDDIKMVACLVFLGLTLAEEAEAFLRINENRRKLQIWQLQHAEVAANRSLAIKAQDHLDRLAANRVGVASLAVLRRFIKTKDKATATIIDLLVLTAKDKHVSARVLTGLVILEAALNRDDDKTLNRKPIITKMLANFRGLHDACSGAVGSQKRTDGKTLAGAIARNLKVKLPKGLA